MSLKIRWSATTAVLCACLALVLAYGFVPLLTYTTAHAGLTVVPSALGIPPGLPGLRVAPLGATTWAWQLAESFGALTLLAAAVLRVRRHVRRRPDSGRTRRLLAGWTTDRGRRCRRGVARVRGSADGGGGVHAAGWDTRLQGRCSARCGAWPLAGSRGSRCCPRQQGGRRSGRRQDPPQLPSLVVSLLPLDEAEKDLAARSS